MNALERRAQSGIHNSLFSYNWGKYITNLILQPLVWCVNQYSRWWSNSQWRSVTHTIASHESKLGPIPQKRERALTNPLPPLTSSDGVVYKLRRSQQLADDQSQSKLLTMLPFEIRQMIYDEVLAGGNDRVVHMRSANHDLSKVCHNRLVMHDDLGSCDISKCAGLWLMYGVNCCHGVSLLEMLNFESEPWILPFLQTCRMIYSEGIKVLYSRNIFHFKHFEHLNMSFGQIPPHRLNSITSVVLHWGRSHWNNDLSNEDNSRKAYERWEKVWATLKQMKGLLDLRVILFQHSDPVMIELWKHKIFQPMMEFQGLRIFELNVPVVHREDWDIPVDGPFRILPYERLLT